MNKNLAIVVLVIVVLGGFFLYQNNQSQTNDEVTIPDDTNFIVDTALVNEIEIVFLESFPVRVQVIAKGDLNDSCTAIGEVKEKRNQNKFLITVETKRPADAICAQVISPFEEIIGLDVIGLKAGKYEVDVNGIKGSFELQSDNILLNNQGTSVNETEEEAGVLEAE